MSTLAPVPTHHHHHHLQLPSKRHLSQLGFLSGIAAGTLSYLVHPIVPPAFLAFVLVWYVVAYGIPEVADHELHRVQWIVHVALFPVGAIAVTASLWIAWPHPVWSVLAGLLAALGLQALITRLFLHGVADDQRHDLRRRLNVE